MVWIRTKNNLTKEETKKKSEHENKHTTKPLEMRNFIAIAKLENIMAML